MSDTVNVFISGDFAPTYRVLDLIQSGEYQLMYNDILPIIRKADIAITNLEVPLIESGIPIKKTGPNLKAPIKSVEALCFAGFNMVTLANNHIMDYGWEGLRSTMEICKRHDIKYIGAGKDLTEAQAIRYLESNDSVIAFVNITENEWSTTQGDEPGANPLNEIGQYYQVSEAKRNSDYVILIIHGGHETYGLPSPRMKKLYRYFIDIGADAVIGHHTHCFSGHEVYNDMPIIYSLGNFIFDSPNFRNDSEWNRGCAVMLKIQNGKVDFELIPYKQCDKTVGVSLLCFDERKAFYEEAGNKSILIQDDKKLAMHFNKFVQSQIRLYSSFLEPIKNRFLLAAMNRGIMPRLINSKQKRLILNLIKAEAHRDILLNLLGLKNN
jgi:poly-gamma-glutamate synthesis protein (capsule biosynthesis protein)